MDPPSPVRRDLEQEEILEDMINDNVDPAESPSSYLNPSGDGIEQNEVDDQRDVETDGSDDGEGDNSGDGEAGEEAGEVYIYIKFDVQQDACKEQIVYV